MRCTDSRNRKLLPEVAILNLAGNALVAVRFPLFGTIRDPKRQDLKRDGKPGGLRESEMSKAKVRLHRRRERIAHFSDFVWIASFLTIALFLPSISVFGRQQQSQQQPSSAQQTASPAEQTASKQSTPQAKIAVETRMVTVYATVSDKKGKLISTLTRDDFTVNQEGQPQSLTYFATQKDLPLTIGLLIDTSRSQTSVLGQERTASYSFLDHMLRDEKDRAFLIHFDHEVELLQDMTSSRKKLQAALDQLNAPELERASDDNQGHSSRGAGTLLYDAVYLASNELMMKEKGRKALVILSDGVDRGSKESLPDAIEAAQRANTVIYSILFKGDEPHGGYRGNHGGGGGPYGHGGGHRYPQEDRPDGKKILERIAKETGGRLFEASKKETADDIYSQIADQLRDQYILGYTPSKDQSGPGYHKIQVTTKEKDLAVQARDGYYGE